MKNFFRCFFLFFSTLISAEIKEHQGILATLYVQDSAWWTNSQSLHTLLVVFCDGEKYSKDSSFLPLISKEVYEFNKKYTI